jgi:cell division protein FtsI/penicillin-binding protein 2
VRTARFGGDVFNHCQNEIQNPNDDYRNARAAVGYFVVQDLLFVICLMLIFDQLKKNDQSLRLLSLVVLGGLLVLLAGLWWVQVVRSRYYATKLEDQSYRTVRVPAPRGQILDRNRQPLAENQPVFNLSLYLQDLSREFRSNYNAAITPYLKQARLTRTKLSRAQIDAVANRTRYSVASRWCWTTPISRNTSATSA